MAEFIEVVKQKNRMCDSISGCDSCGLVEIHCGFIPDDENMEKYEKIVMDWAKEHPVMTNADKFKEVFGADINYDDGDCTGFDCTGFDCPSDENCITCKYKGFWDKEYIEPKEQKNE